MKPRAIHHVSLTVRDLERSLRFYRDVLGLEEIARPAFPFAGAWFQVGATQQLHLIVHSEATFRGEKPLDTKDVHVALRVDSYCATLELLRAKGFNEDADPSDATKMIARPTPVAGFAQIYILDPDRHVIELNSEIAE